MVGNLIDAYSETMLHFYPSDKRILYKAHTIRARQGITDIKELAEAINKSFEQDALEGKGIPKNKLTSDELSALMNGASTVSADATVNDEGYGVYDYTEDSKQDTEGSYMAREETNNMLQLVRTLPLLHRKVLMLKGIKV